MITAREMALAAAGPPRPALSRIGATPLAERILIATLFVTVLAAPIAFIEPSPHDALMGALAFACVAAGTRFDRTLVLPLLFLLIWNVSGLFSLINVAGQEKTAQYAGTSVYLAVAALVFACVLASNTMPRVTALRIAYVAAATVCAAAGISGYLHLFPGAADHFTEYGRAMGTFKDPNVYSPYLIWPLLFLVYRMVTERIAFLDLMAAGIILLGLLMSFSRGAWFHFIVSAGIAIALGFVTAPTHKARMRIFSLTAFSIVGLVALVVLLMSVDSIGHMFRERAQLIQSYDVGQGGRFRLQELALTAVLQYPNGLGPFEFGRINGLQQHNVYLQAFLVYGWAGGVAYVLLLISTVFAGLRAALIRTPWQPYVITALGAFIGEIVEGFVIDTDHWRHFFLLLGMVWGLAAASFRERRATVPVPRDATVAPR